MKRILIVASAFIRLCRERKYRLCSFYRDGYPLKDTLVTKRFKLSVRKLQEEGAWE